MATGVRKKVDQKRNCTLITWQKNKRQFSLQMTGKLLLFKETAEGGEKEHTAPVEKNKT